MEQKNSLIDKRYYILIYLLILIVCALYLNEMFEDMKYNGYVNVGSLETIPSGYKEAWYILLTFAFGSFYGANIITLLDKKKRLQGILILVASSVVIFAFPHIIYLRKEVFLLGVVVSGLVSYINRKKIADYLKYPTATLIVSFLVIFSVWASYGNYIFGLPESNKDNIYTSIWYLLLTVVFTGVFYKFTRYEISNSKVFVVGPRASGKTVFMCGCYEKAKDNKKTIGLPSDDLTESLGMLRSGDWPEGTVTTKSLMFSYEHGTLFVKDVTIDSFDYPGELLEHEIESIVKYLEKKSKGPKLKPDDGVQKIADKIYNADKLIFVIDGTKIGKKTADTVDYVGKFYLKILRKIPNKQHYVVITKSDVFYEKSWGLNEQGYNALKEKVVRELETREPFFEELKKYSYDIIPIFFLEDIDKKPVLKDNKFVTVGYDEVLEVAGK